MYFVHNPGIGVLLVLILALVAVLSGVLIRRGRRTSPGPDTRVQRALTASEVERDALRHATTSHAVRPRPAPTNIPVPPPRGHYDRLRESADRRIAAEGPLTTELTAISPEQVEADRRALLGVVQPPVQPAPVSTAERSLLDMTVPELMAKIEAEAKTALIPKQNGAPVLPDLPDRRVHAELPDGSQVVRYERAGKWFHEGPGLRSKLTLGQAAILASGPGAKLIMGLPGGGLLDLRVKRAREAQA